MHRVFSQTPSGRLDLGALMQNSRKFFEASVEVLEERGLVTNVTGTHTSAPFVRLRITSSQRGFATTFRVTCRAARAEDWEAAREAELRGRATGMGLLADRCQAVWEVEAEEPESPDARAALLNLSAILASVALGPVLPADGSTLYGVRGAMERLEALGR